MRTTPQNVFNDKIDRKKKPKAKEKTISLNNDHTAGQDWDDITGTINLNHQSKDAQSHASMIKRDKSGRRYGSGAERDYTD